MNTIKTNNQKQNFDISWIQKDVHCWVYQPNQSDNDVYQRGIIKAIIPLNTNKANSKVAGQLENGASFESRANQIEKCRESNSLQRDLIQMDTINTPQILRQLKRRLLQRKIHTLMWNSLIIVNPFKLIPEQYGQKCLVFNYDHIFTKREDMRKHEPHIYSFMMHILSNISQTTKTQVISISGESGSGKTETNKQALKAITFCSSQMFREHKSAGNLIQPKILKCDQILQVFGNAKTVKNDNSSRFGKLIILDMDKKTFKIRKSSVKNYFLEKSRIILQNPGERNFHIFYQLLAYLPEEQKSALRLKNGGYFMRHDDFKYLTNRNSSVINQDRRMWEQLNKALAALQFGRQLVLQIWTVIAVILLLGNLGFETTTDNQPCDLKNPQVAESIAYLLGLQKKQITEAFTTQKRVVAGQSIISGLNLRDCALGRDSVAKAMYESLFSWLVTELNKRLNVSYIDEHELKVLKLLDIYGFEVFDHNSFEQLCVNFTNQKIHQIYLQQIFIHEKEILKKEGLEFVIQKLNFTDNIKIIQLIETLSRSVFNLLDQNCTINVKDEDFLNSIKKHHQNHQHFPSINSNNTRKTFIIKHTPGDIEYVAQGFRDKNKDFIRDDLLSRLSNTKIKLISNSFRQKLQILKHQGNKKFLGIKIRKQVKELINQMSMNTDLHFIRCIKSNQKKQPFNFVDKVCLNQIRYLGIIDTIQMRKDTYHIRTPYRQFYTKYGILQNKLNILVPVSEGRFDGAECKSLSMRFVNDLINYDLDYQYGRQSIFLKMATQNRLDALLKKKLSSIECASSRIKAQYRYKKMKKIRQIVRNKLPTIQRALSNYLLRVRMFKRKNAVLKIESSWQMNQEVFLARKKLTLIKRLQKYIKTGVQEQKALNKRIAIIRAKQLLKSLASANILQQKIQNFKDTKNYIRYQLYQYFWDFLQDHYLKNLSRYLKGGANILANSKAIKKADQATDYRLNIRYKRIIEKYLKSSSIQIKYDKKMEAIIKIQSIYRMLRNRKRYLSLRKQAIKIQRNWKKYYYDKQFSLKFTENFFENGGGGQIRQEKQYWRTLLHRNIVKNQEKGMEKLLLEQQRVKVDKIGLFYYLLDFEILTGLGNLYPNNSWIENYNSLYEQTWNKGNPIQMLDVSDTETIACTLNKAYVWGDVHFENFESERSSYQNWNKVKSLQTPPGRINKIHAHHRFSVVEIEDQEPFIVGDEHLYQLDCSSKEWKTLTQSYIIINGTILTLKKVQFSRLSISEKVTQLSCGMSHCIAKTSLKKVYAWGDNSKGQLGLGQTCKQRMLKPKLLQFFIKQAITVHQVAASAHSCMVLESNNRILWWGSNGTISLVNSPKQMYLFQKSAFLDNPQKYTVVRILASWSKSLSIIGVTIAAHESIFKSSQNAIKKKTYQNLITKWNQDIRTVMPPTVQTVSGYFQEKFMPKSKIEAPKKGLKELQHQRIRQKLLSQIILMEEAERALLKQRKKF